MNTAWAKSSYSNSFSNCVEVAVDWRKFMRCQTGECVEIAAASSVLVRDSQDPSGPILTFTHGEWGAFLAGIKDGELAVPAVPLVAAGAC